MSSRATLIGFSAVLMWALLALLTASSGRVPPFQLLAMTLLIGGLLGAVSWIGRPAAIARLRQPLPVWMLGVGGIFGYHFFYYTALRNAPPVEAGLVAYLWPLLIVVFSAALPGERLRWFHLFGAVLGLAGTALIVTKGGAVSFEPAHGLGFAAAGLCALTWSSYSILSRRFPAVPTDAVAGFCLVGAGLSAGCHLLFETSRWPEAPGEWLAVAGLGLMPVGAAFYAWDYGVKRGDIQVLGAAAYTAPLLSTLILIAFGFGELTLVVAAAALLITGGAVIAAHRMLLRRD